MERISIADYAAEREMTITEAIEQAEGEGYSLNKYADPIEDARENISQYDARAIARVDPSLIYLA